PRLVAGCRHLARAAAAGVTVIGGLVLVGWALDGAALRSLVPGLTAMNPGGTALAFLLAGPSLWLQLDPAGRHRPVGRALAAGVVALLAVVGYAYSAAALAGVEQFIPMALNTAAALGLLCTGILCARPTQGAMAVVTSTGAGGVMLRRLLPAAILVPVAVGW